MVGHVDVARARVGLVEGSWELTKYSVENVGLNQPAMRARGSKIVKMKRGIGGRVEVMFVGLWRICVWIQVEGCEGLFVGTVYGNGRLLMCMVSMSFFVDVQTLEGHY